MAFKSFAALAVLLIGLLAVAEAAVVDKGADATVFDEVPEATVFDEGAEATVFDEGVEIQTVVDAISLFSAKAKAAVEDDRVALAKEAAAEAAAMRAMKTSIEEKWAQVKAEMAEIEKDAVKEQELLATARFERSVRSSDEEKSEMEGEAEVEAEEVEAEENMEELETENTIEELDAEEPEGADGEGKTEASTASNGPTAVNAGPPKTRGQRKLAALEAKHAKIIAALDSQIKVLEEQSKTFDEVEESQRTAFSSFEQRVLAGLKIVEGAMNLRWQTAQDAAKLAYKKVKQMETRVKNKFTEKILVLRKKKLSGTPVAPAVSQLRKWMQMQMAPIRRQYAGLRESNESLHEAKKADFLTFMNLKSRAMDELNVLKGRIDSHWKVAREAHEGKIAMVKKERDDAEIAAVKEVQRMMKHLKI